MVGDRVAKLQAISIHALREEGDVRRHSHRISIKNFYPRPPRGGRPPEPPARSRPYYISIHALREEGDLAVADLTAELQISIHALREEGDRV